jgi:hypothetical protein
MLLQLKEEVLTFLEKYWIYFFTIGVLIGAFVAWSQHMQSKVC